MKKIIALLLVMTMAIGLTACGKNNNGDQTTTQEQIVPASALEILENIWNAYEDKFFAMGGDMENMVDNAPGNYSLTDEGLTATLLVPEAQIANIDQAASLVHGMLINNFACGVYHVTGDVDAFVQAMYQSISTHPWLCGTPDKMLIAVIGGEYVLAGFGINDAIGPFEQKLAEVYPQADIKHNQSLAG